MYGVKVQYERGVTPERAVILASGKYPRLREELTQLTEGEWLKVSIAPSNQKTLLEQPDAIERVASRIRAAVYTWSSASRLRDRGKRSMTFTDRASDGTKADVWITIVPREE